MERQSVIDIKNKEISYSNRVNKDTKINENNQMSFEQILNAQMIQGNISFPVKPYKQNTKNYMDELSNRNKLKIMAMNFKKNA